MHPNTATGSGALVRDGERVCDSRRDRSRSTRFQFVVLGRDHPNGFTAFQVIRGARRMVGGGSRSVVSTRRYGAPGDVRRRATDDRLAAIPTDPEALLPFSSPGDCVPQVCNSTCCERSPVLPWRRHGSAATAQAAATPFRRRNPRVVFGVRHSAFAGSRRPQSGRFGCFGSGTPVVHGLVNHIQLYQIRQIRDRRRSTPTSPGNGSNGR